MTAIYLIPIILAAIWCFLYDDQKEFDSRKSHRFWLLCIILSLITGFSYALGGDKQKYLTEFEEYPNEFYGWLEEIEERLMTKGEMPLWVLLNCFAKNVFNSFYPVQLIEAFWINIAVFHTVKRYTQRVFFFVLLYCFTFTYFTFNTEVMREAFAIGFCLYGMETYFRKKYAHTVLLFTIAIFWHVSSIVMVLFLFTRFKVTPKRLMFTILASATFWALSNLLFSQIVSSFLGEKNALFTRVLMYSTFKVGPIAYILYLTIYILAPFCIMHYGIPKGLKDKEVIARKEHLMAFYLCIGAIVPSFLPLARFLNYALIAYYCMLTDTLYTLFQDKKHIITKAVCCFIAVGYYTFQYITCNPRSDARYYDLWFPYTSIFDEDSYNRNRRQQIHFSVLTNKKAEENTREVEE